MCLTAGLISAVGTAVENAAVSAAGSDCYILVTSDSGPRGRHFHVGSRNWKLPIAAAEVIQLLHRCSTEGVWLHVGRYRRIL
jgi:hypothetical protein